jgi:DNA-binding transcriptional LysR family regulator
MSRVDRWFGVEFRHLAALIAIADTCSFRAAADELGYVQSAVSQQIAALERLVGARLVERTRGHSEVSLTELGEALAEHARAILTRLDAACADLHAAAHGARRVSLGLSQSLAARLLPPILKTLSRRTPTLEVCATEAISEPELFELVQSGTLDVAFAELPLDGGPFETRKLLTDDTVLVLPAGHDPILENPTLAEIAQLDLIRPTSWRTLELLETEFAAAGLRLHFTAGSSTDAGVQALVADGIGGALMPRLAVELGDPRIRTIELDHQLLPERTIVAFWHAQRHHGPAHSAFVETSVSIARELKRRRRADRTTKLEALAA